MYQDNPHLAEVPDDAPLWRYVSFAKFVSMVRASALYFARADRFEDRWEGVYTLPTTARIRQQLDESNQPHFDALARISHERYREAQ